MKINPRSCVRGGGVPDQAPAWVQERSRLWNAAEVGETAEGLGDGRDPGIVVCGVNKATPALFRM